MSKRKILLISAMCVLAVYIAMWFLCPLVNPKSVYWIADEDGLIDLDYYKSAVAKPDAAAQQMKSGQLFPSDEVKDYCTVVVGISAINISPFQLSNFGLMVDYQDENSNGVIVLPPIFPSQQGKAFSKVQERYMTSFLVYRNGKTDEEIISELQKVEVILYYDTVIKSYFKRVKLSDLSYQIMDDWYSYPKGWDVPVEAIPEGAEGIE